VKHHNLGWVLVYLPLKHLAEEQHG
jgi:hypothetical protein